ncbi:hypothetical protein HDU87_006151 [Geranomyces variabilis]|uniref:Small ribosomal subunit protein uS7 domain-containing protein n=1 Tax=Geranomyces variabilis TaxID=109894 RepID=A0AAD5TI72_9FUNG|nr:hypothetical protein HDU87_006151 [Geranomyces variabilis]
MLQPMLSSAAGPGRIALSAAGRMIAPHIRTACLLQAAARPISARFLSTPTPSSTTSSSTSIPSPSAYPGGADTLNAQPAIDMTTGHAARIASILHRNEASLPLHVVPEAEKTGSSAASPTITNKQRRRETELTLIEAFVNNIMKDGKKARARRTMEDALAYIRAADPASDPHATLAAAVAKVSPLVKIVTTKRGAKGIQTPTPLSERQRRRFGILWIVEAASGVKVGLTFGQRIGAEVLAIMKDESAALQKRTNIHKQALSNRSNILMVDRRMRRSF